LSFIDYHLSTIVYQLLLIIRNTRDLIFNYKRFIAIFYIFKCHLDREKIKKIINDWGFFYRLFASDFYCESKEKKYLLATPVLELALALRELNHLPSKLMLYYGILFLPPLSP